AVPRALAGDEASPPHLAFCRVILERDLETGFDGFRSAGHEHYVLEVAAAFLGDDGGQLFERIAGEVVTIAMSDALELAGDGGIHFLVAMTDAIDGRPGRAVDIQFPRAVSHT